MYVSEIERRKLIWRKIGDWMDYAKSGDALPEYPGFSYSSSEKKLIDAILQSTAEKRIELIKLEWRVIESFHPDYRWSDLIAYPDVQKAIKSIGFSEETWIEGVLSMLLRMRPSSVAIRQMQIIAKVKQELLNGTVNIALQTLENSIRSEEERHKENHRNRRKGKTKYPDEKIKEAVSAYRNWQESKAPKALQKTMLGDIKMMFSDEEDEQPDDKTIKRWVEDKKY